MLQPDPLKINLAILGLTEKDDLSEANIKKVYRKKALKLHPDHNAAPDAKEKFVELDNAYKALLSHVKSLKENAQKTKPERIKRKENDRAFCWEFPGVLLGMGVSFFEQIHHNMAAKSRAEHYSLGEMILTSAVSIGIGLLSMRFLKKQHDKQASTYYQTEEDIRNASEEEIAVLRAGVLAGGTGKGYLASFGCMNTNYQRIAHPIIFATGMRHAGLENDEIINAIHRRCSPK